MASTKVEIIGGQLSGAVLDNAASEATLRDLVNSINKMNSMTARAMGGGSGGGAGGGGGGGTAGSFNALSKAANGLGAALGTVTGSLAKFGKGAIGAMAGLTTNLLKGSERLSEYSRVLNDELIGNLPVVGGALSALGSVVVATIELIEGWNDNLKQSSKFGASFNNSISELKAALNGTSLEAEDLISVVRQNAAGFTGLGGTVTKGAKAFVNVAKSMPLQKLMDMGFTIEEVQGGLGQYLTTVARGSVINKASTASLSAGAERYIKNLDLLSKLTGKSAEQLQNDMAVASQDAMYRLEMLKLGKDEREKMEKGLQDFVARFGAGGAELYKQIALQMPPLTQNTRLYAATLPGVVQEVENLQRAAKNTSIGVDKFGSIAKDALVDSIMSAVRSGRDLDGVLRAAASGMGDTAGNIYEVFGPILKQIADLGGPAELTREKLLDMIKSAEEEQKKRDPLVSGLNSVTLAARKMKQEIQDIGLEAVQSVIKAFGGDDGKGGLAAGATNLSTAFKKFSDEVLRPLAKELGPALKGFITQMNSPEGRDAFVNSIKLMMSEAMIELKYSIGKDSWMARQLGIGIGEEDYNRLKDELKGRTTTEGLNYKGPALREFMATVAQAEGGGDPSTGHPTDPKTGKKLSTALGAFQITEETLKGINKQFNTNFSMEDRQDPKKSVQMMQLLAGQRLKEMQTLGGRQDFTAEEQYLGHFFGAEGAIRLFRAPRNDLVSKHVSPKSFEANQATLVKRDGTVRTVQEVIDNVSNHFRKKRAEALSPGASSFVKDILGSGFYSGTLGAGGIGGNPGSQGRYFADFGSGRFTKLHGMEAVLTPKQLVDTVAAVSDATAKSFIGAGSQNGMGEMISGLNTNISTLIGLSKEQLNISKLQLSVQRKLNPDLFAV
jgi:hypothetical protein